jgi:hypothetical protein
MRTLNRPVTLIAVASVVFAAAAGLRLQGAQGPDSAPTTQQIEFFETRIRPLLVEVCYDCHTEDEKGGLRLDSREGMLKGGDSGPAIVPGDPDASLLIKTVRHVQGIPKMPRSADPLAEAQIAFLEDWIRMGAPWPVAAAAVAGPVPARVGDRPIDPALRAFWSFQPLAQVDVPAVRDTGWPKTDLDRFVLARMERDGLTPVAAADRRTLIRRATLQITGLPATAEEIDAFEKDDAPDAFEKVVDRLLASPHYGETWGRHWLDVARYAEDDPRSLDPMGRGSARTPTPTCTATGS